MPRRSLEERVVGAVWGANGYTTLDRTDELLDHLALTQTPRLLEVGNGPRLAGPFLAQESGCSVVGTDPP